MKTTRIYSVVEVICGKPSIVNFTKSRPALAHFAEVVKEQFESGVDSDQEVAEAIKAEEYIDGDDYAVYIQHTDLRN